jgi:hypothetical protein
MAQQTLHPPSGSPLALVPGVFGAGRGDHSTPIGESQTSPPSRAATNSRRASVTMIMRRPRQSLGGALFQQWGQQFDQTSPHATNRLRASPRRAVQLNGIEPEQVIQPVVRQSLPDQSPG